MSNTNTTDKNLITIVVSAALVVVSAIISVAYYNVNDRILMSKNIDAAITKGMDPLSVRCSYANSGDTTCVAYAAAQTRR